MNALLALRATRAWLAVACAVALAACGQVKPTTLLPVRIVNFGPTPVDHGKSFNPQPNGDSAIWVRTENPVDPRDVLVLDGHPLQTTIIGNLLTAAVPLSLIATPGPKPLLVELDSATARAQSPAVSFVVK